MFEDPFAGVYKKLLFNREGTRLLGGILVGDAGDYGTLSMLAKSDRPASLLSRTNCWASAAASRQPSAGQTR